MGVSVRHTLFKIEVDIESQLSRIHLTNPTDIEGIVNLEVLNCPKEEEEEEVVKLAVVVDDENNIITVMDPAITGYEPPKWAGRPPSGYHLDVAKDGKMFQKLMVDEKPYYLFGRNMNMTDFCIDHGSCSRVHAALVYHKHLDRFFLTDLGSTHGSHIGNVRLEPNKPTQLPIDTSFHFGASTRIYTLREKPKSSGKQDSFEEEAAANLPETEYELDNLTEFNTAHNRRICTIGITTESGDIVQAATARKRKSVTFNEEEDVINPEDIDPTVGKFRNLIQSTIVIPSSQPSKRARLDNGGFISGSSLSFLPRINPAPQTISQPSHQSPSSTTTSSHFIKSLGITLPSIAPDLDRAASSSGSSVDFGNTSDYLSQNSSGGLYDDLVPDDDGTSSSSKKKYAKEAWPGHHAHGTPLANF